MAEISIGGGLVAIVDEEDIEKVRRFKWYPQRKQQGSRIYAEGHMSIGGGKQKTLRMARLILVGS
jgi:hypothetical protein